MAQEFTDFEVAVDLADENVKAWGGEQSDPPDVGDYEFIVDNVEQVASKEKQTPMIKVKFLVDSEGPFKGFPVWNNYALTQKALGRLKQLQVATGGRLDKFVASELLGARLAGTVIHSMGQGGADANGNVLAPRVFANLINERPIEGEQAAAPAPAPAPPIKAAQTKPATQAPAQKPAVNNGAARRA